MKGSKEKRQRDRWREIFQPGLWVTAQRPETAGAEPG